jgi:nitrogen fixation/metabolism regulation signal transduction histidine kinase
MATGLRLRVVVAVPEPPGTAPRYLQLMQAVPVNLASNAQVLQTAYSEYQNRAFSRTGLRKMYIETLTLTLLLAIFSAIGSAFLIAGNLAQPLLVLAEGTRAVAEGDLSPRPIVETNDELGTLTQSFNAMTGQLFEARSAVERNRSALESAKAHLESVLGNMSAGVIVMDADGVVVNSNDAVHRILQVDANALAGHPLDEIEGLEAFAGAVTRAFSAQSAAQSAHSTARLGRRHGDQRTHWQQQIEVPRRAGTSDDHDLTLLARGSRLPVGAGSGFIVVFDDISDVISAQRSVAWGEVARRLAHEIKNPLTPIQLSAERMQMKLADRLDPQGAALLKKGTDTIVTQVDAMKRMVDDFRDYAKAPPAVLEPLDLNELISQILNLYLAEDGSDVIHAALGANLPRVMGDATQLRQVIHNLLQNAQDALADAPPARRAAAHRRGHRGHPLRGRGRRRRHRGAPGDRRQRPRFRPENPVARLRTLRHLEGPRHRSWPADGQKDRRRTRGPDRRRQPRGRIWRFGIDFAVKVSTRGELGRELGRRVNRA